MKPARSAKPASPLALRSVVITNRHPGLKFDRRALTRAIHTLDQAHARIRVPRPSFLRGELSIVLLTDAALAQLHDEFLQDPTVTDVITFEGNPAFGTAGEICVSADAAQRQVGRARDPHAFSSELMLYITHGWLHLAGYDDLAPAKKRAMRRAEARSMAVLRRSGQSPRFTLQSRGSATPVSGKRRAKRRTST